MCSAPNVYMFVYTLIGAQIVPLKWTIIGKLGHAGLPLYGLFIYVFLPLWEHRMVIPCIFNHETTKGDTVLCILLKQQLFYVSDLY